MRLTELQKELKTFVDATVKEAKRNLSRQRKNSTGKLSKSIKGTYKVSKNSIFVEFEMDAYGNFQDQGVKGVGGKKANGQAWKQNAPRSPFKFKKSKKPSAKHFRDWSRKKGLNEYAVRNAVFHKGIKPSLFFTKAYQRNYKKLSQGVVDKFGLDVDYFMTDLMKKI